MRLPLPALLAAALLSPAAPAPAQTEDWMLAGREGGCFPIHSLRRKLPELPDVRSPDALEAWLRSKGHAVTRKTHGPEMVGLDAPALGLHLMLIPARRCAASGRG
jgi:hypothetical protein